MTYFSIFIIIAFFQALIAAIFNVKNGTRIPRSIKDFFKLILLPYVLMNSKKIREY